MAQYPKELEQVERSEEVYKILMGALEKVNKRLRDANEDINKRRTNS
jgi:glycine cleavage system H lipoate-binding protein